MMKTRHFAAGLFLTILTGAPAALPAAAAPVITVVASGSFSLLNLGVGAPNSRQAITSPFIVNSSGIVTIVFSGGAGTDDSSQASGVYAGNQGVAASPLGVGNSTTNYLAAQPDPDLAHNVTLNYAAPQTVLDMLWGTADAAAGYNLITTSTGETITGAQVLAVLGNPASGSTNAWLEITGLSPFTWVAATDSNGNSSAFEFLPAAVVTVPEPASIVLLGTALMGFGIVKRRRRSA